MKLFSRLYRLNLFATLVIFILSSVVYYLLVRFVIIDQFDGSLQIERIEIEKLAAKANRLPNIPAIKDRIISFGPSTGFEASRFETVVAYDTVGGDHAEFRKLFFSLRAGNQWYRGMVGKSMEGTEHLIHSVIGITIGTILLILLVSTTINRVVLKRLWQPFYHGLQLMKEYEVGRKGKFVFPKSDTEEFAFMNTVLQQATGKADNDYRILKEFTENASHEMQTPLAIIRSKIDLLIQDENTGSRHEKNFMAMYQAIEKLTNLNHSLLLLTKIGNKQFSSKTELNLADTLHGKLIQFEELLLEKNLSLSVQYAAVKIRMNPELLDTLLNNLVSNAIKHNKQDGEIEIVLSQPKRLTIMNTGAANPLDDRKVFTRFYKPEQSDHTGLGLSILKEICVVSGSNITYMYKPGKHFFIVEWE
ncbi:MAG: HAMP domain-containing histidine kinase [Chitinophagaceae bacterium]|nr:MAG: HAMP domain-containing histidine kinase [Chitinophagaceae bacterium]